MSQEDEEKTSFVTPFGTYSFKRMAEGLRNAGSIFARTTTKMLKEDKSISTYVGDIVV
jgi:mannitol/fructose-specific phosphotransferase system IIA component